MNYSVQLRRPADYREATARRVAPTRAGYILAVSGALAVVTFTLVYLATSSYTLGF